MTWFPAHEEVPDPVQSSRALEETRSFWTDWVAQSGYRGEYREEVVRSLITLKALIHRPTGGIVAAPTASLPERPGGERNWDYRFCWLRDSTFTLLAFLQAGMVEEASAWVAWLRRAVAGEPIMLQPFYKVGGDRRIQEWEAPWLAGFNGARPVRFGNAAAAQLQLDVFGEVIETLHIAHRHGMEEDDDTSTLVRLLAEKLEEIWEQPDAGIWESRGPLRHHVYSKVMCWVAFDRASSWFKSSDPAAADRFRGLAERVKQQVLEKGYDEELGSFVVAYGEKALDAATLRLPLVGFLPASDPRMLGTVAAIERGLMEDGLVRRYEPTDLDDGVGGREGAFFAATYWLADVYALAGREEEATRLFERLCSLSNDVGLLSEEWGDGRMLGNFPQALSHLSLVSTALNLGAGKGPADERCGDEAGSS